MTGGELMTVVGFFLMLFGAISGVWWRIEGRVDKAKQEATDKAMAASMKADIVVAQLAGLRIHVAENYVSKAGHREMTDAVMDAIGAVRTAVDGLSMRVDRIFEAQAKTTRPRS